MKRLSIFLVITLALTTLVAAGFGQIASAAAVKKGSYPDKGKPISLLVPYGAGGATDTAGRIMAAAMEKFLEPIFRS